MLRSIKKILELKVRDYIFCLASALLLILSFPDFNLEFLAWIAFLPLFFALKNKTKIQAFIIAYLCGVIFWLGTVYWLIHVTGLGMILLVLYLALYFGFFGLLVSGVTGFWLLLTIPALWVILEYLRSHLLTGLGWALLGYSQYQNLAIIQISDITGAWGVSFLVMMFNVFVFQMASRRLKKVTALAACVIFLGASGYGFMKLRPTTSALRPTPLKISVIQGNISQELKWKRDSQGFIILKYLNISRLVRESQPDLVVWPEAALPVILEEEPAYFKMATDFSRQNQIPLLLGAVTLRDNSYYNSAILVSSLGRLAQRYDKLHLVPFGEYIPLRNLLPFLETIVPIGDISRGKEYTVFRLQTAGGIPETKFGVLICFEDVFPELAAGFVRRGADFLVNITNDGWYKKTSAAKQHFQASVFRAVENRVFLIRAANTGVSGFISPLGEIISLVKDENGQDIFVEGYATQEIKIAKRQPSLYTRYGDIFIIFCLLIVFSGIIVSIKKKT